MKYIIKVNDKGDLKNILKEKASYSERPFKHTLQISINLFTAWLL